MKTYSKQVAGTVSEILAEQFFVSRGCVVSKPINDFNEYDFVVDDGFGLKRVQVKTVYWDNSKNRWLISTVTSHIRGDEHRYNKKYSLDSYDILLAVHKETGTAYVIPVGKAAGRRAITLYPDGKPDTVNSRYQDFENYADKLII